MTRLRSICLLLVILSVSGCVATTTFKIADLELGNIPQESISGLFTKPQGKGPFPAVVLLHSCGGFLEHVSNDWPNFLTKHGFATLSVDTFGSRNESNCRTGGAGLTGITMWSDAYGALDYLRNRSDIIRGKIAVMGFSAGGNAIESFSTQDIPSRKGKEFSAGIVVYGQCTIDDKPKFPILEIVGSLDRMSFSCKYLSGATVKIIEGATHGFDQPQLRTPRVIYNDHEAVYDYRATEIARATTLEFLRKYLGP